MSEVEELDTDFNWTVEEEEEEGSHFNNPQFHSEVFVAEDERRSFMVRDWGAIEGVRRDDFMVEENQITRHITGN